MPISLHKDLALGGWHSSIATTYSVDPPFYDLYMERRLRTYGGAVNNILMADARMLKIALEAMPEGFAAAGSRYAVIPVKVKGAFHPKVHLRFGEQKARLIVGSANVTAAGWGRNREVIAGIDWKFGDDSRNNQAMGALVVRVFSYLTGWLGAAPGDVMRYKLQLLGRKSPWLQDLQTSRGPIQLEDGTAVDLFCESGGGTPSIFRQFTDLVSGEKVRRVTVISPYWDADLNGFLALRKTLGMVPAFVVLNPKSSTFPINALSKKDSLKFVNFEDSQRFLHAKTIVVETRQADHILFGSANCSDDALGLLLGAARNAEVCLYRRMAPQTVISELGIDLRRTLARESVSVPVAQSSKSKDEVNFTSAGEMELIGRTLTWWPPSGMDAKGAVIRIQDMSTTPHALAPSKWTAELEKSPTYPVIAQVAYADGRLSDLVIVHGAARLRRTAPPDIHAALSEALRKARKGEADLLELALQAHIIFSPDSQVESRSGSERLKKRAERHEKAVQYATPEEFRKAVSLRAASGKTGLFAHDDPGLQEVLAVVLRGINAALPQDDSDFDQEVDEADLLAGDTEDEDEDDGLQFGNEDDVPENPRNGTEPIGGKHSFTSKELLQRRGYLLRALDRFYELLSDLLANPSKITTRIAGQTIFFLWLIRYGCRFEHPGIMQGPTRLMVLSHKVEDQREFSFVIRTMRILLLLWRGKDAIASHIKVDSRHGELQDDLYGFAVHSRWALARAYLLALDYRDLILAKRIAAAALEILPATHRLGPVDADAERETMVRLDADLGCAPQAAEALLRCCKEFETAAKSATPIEMAAQRMPKHATTR